MYKKKINLPLSMGDLNHLKKADLKDFLESDIYVVFWFKLYKGFL